MDNEVFLPSVLLDVKSLIQYRICIYHSVFSFSLRFQLQNIGNDRFWKISVFVLGPEKSLYKIRGPGRPPQRQVVPLHSIAKGVVWRMT